MTKPKCSLKLDEVCKVLIEVAGETEKMAAKVFEGFLRHNRKILQESETIGAQIEQDVKRLTQMVVAAREESKLLDSSTVLEVANGLQKIKYSLDKITGHVRAKIEEGVLFSDKAVLELKDFFTAVMDGLGQIGDLVLTGNRVLSDYLLQKVEKYEETGRQYAEEHQDRLIKGICLPKSSLIYLIILDSLKDVLRYLKSIALAFGEKKK